MRTLRHLRERILDMNMSQKLCVLFSAILIVSIFLTYYITYQASSRSIESVTKSLMIQAAETTVTMLDNTIQTANLITIAPLYSPSLQRAFESGREMTAYQEKDSQFFFTFLNSMPLSTHAAGFYSKDGTLIFSRIPVTSYSVFERSYQTWSDSLLTVADSGSALVLSMDAATGYPCAVLRTVYNTDNFQPIGMASVCISSSDFRNAFDKISDIPGGRALVTDYFGQVIFDSSGELQNESPARDTIASELLKNARSFTSRVDGEDYIGITVDHLSGQYRVLIYSPRRILLSEMRSTLLNVFFLAMLVLLMALIMIQFTSRTLTKPLCIISGLMEEVRAGDFSVRFHSKTHDEIGMLGENFNLLLAELEHQIEQRIAISSKKSQIEIDLLKSQINPHFIYNTLETIRMMAVASEQDEIAEITKVFGRIMRYNVSSINELTSLEQEIRYLKDYIFIQNVRFQNRFFLDTQIDPDCLDYQMIKFLLQPIIENAVQHGLEPHTKLGKITLTAQSKGGDLSIVISDNGAGIRREALSELMQELNGPTLSIERVRHLGLKNINDRIKLYYGDQYGISIQSEFGKGTDVEVLIPGRTAL